MWTIRNTKPTDQRQDIAPLEPEHKPTSERVDEIPVEFDVGKYQNVSCDSKEAENEKHRSNTTRVPAEKKHIYPEIQTDLTCKNSIHETRDDAVVKRKHVRVWKYNSYQQC